MTDKEDKTINSDGSVTLRLTYPISIDGKPLREITLKRPKVKMLKDVNNMTGRDEERELQMFGKLTGVNPEELGELDMYDYQRLQEVYAGFLYRHGPIARTSA